MNIFIPNLCLVLYILTKVNGTEVTTQKDPATTSNDAKSSNTEAVNQKIGQNLDKSNDDTTKASTKIPPSKFDIKDFKVTKLKANHNEEDTEDCLATANPEKVEAVRKTLKNSEPSDLNEEEARIAACLKTENTKTTNTITTEKDNKTATKTPLETVEDVDMKLEDKGNNTKKGRRDTEYQFDPLDYYDDMVTFDPKLCPDDVEVITLQVAEVRQYDVECELLTHWIGLVDHE